MKHSASQALKCHANSISPARRRRRRPRFRRRSAAPNFVSGERKILVRAFVFLLPDTHTSLDELGGNSRQSGINMYAKPNGKAAFRPQSSHGCDGWRGLALPL